MLWFAPLSAARAASSETGHELAPPTDQLASIALGLPVRFLSATRYANSRQATFTLSQQWGPRSLLLPRPAGAFESVLLDLRLSRIWGREIPLEADEVSPAHAARFAAWGRPPTGIWNAWQIGVLPCYRISLSLPRETRPYVELGAGAALLSQPLIDNGTTWNFLLAAGAGVEKEIAGVPFHVALRAEHFSNFAALWKRFGFNKANIGVESLALSVGFRGLGARRAE